MITTNNVTPAFLNDGGVMGAQIRSKDWTSTSMGAPANWPQSLKTSINILLNSKFPMFVWWGSDLITFYNDSYIVIAGEKHPDLLGKSGRLGWAEIWDDLQPLTEKVFSGISTWSEDLLLNMNRHGYVEETYFTFSYSPIFNEDGQVEGLFCACIETTEKVLSARKLKKSEENLRNTILQSPVAMCIFNGPSFIVKIANTRMYELWGRSADKLLDKPIFEGLPEASEQGLEAILREVFETGEAFHGSERPVTLPRNGSTETVYLNFVYEPFREGDGTISGIIAVAIDVTAQVIARKKIEESEQELQQRVKDRTKELVKQNQLVENIMTNSSNGISVTEMVRDDKGDVCDARTILANDAAVRNTGLTREEYLSKTAREIDPGIIESAYGQSCINTLNTGEPFVIQYFLELTGKWLELTVSRMDEDHLIHIFTDVTTVKETQLQLEKMLEELKRSNTNLEEFAYAASHDLKEPVRKILTFLERLKDSLKEKLNEQEKGLVERIETSSRRMQMLIDDLLRYSHVTSEAPDYEEIDLNKKLQLVLDDLALKIEEKKAKVTVGDLPVVRAIRRQIQQLFQNLISNALKFTKPGIEPEITVSAKEVRGEDLPVQMHDEEKEKQFHLITVTDNGIGFDKENGERIFNMFQRLHGKAEYEGTGIGLAIVKKVVQNHNGYVWADSTPGEGATFSIALPAR